MTGELDDRQAELHSGRTGRTAFERATPQFSGFAGMVSRSSCRRAWGEPSLHAAGGSAGVPDRAALRGGRRSGHARGDPAAKRLLREALRPIAEPGGATALVTGKAEGVVATVGPLENGDARAHYDYLTEFGAVPAKLEMSGFFLPEDSITAFRDGKKNSSKA